MVSSRKPSLRDDPSPFSPSRGFFMVGFGWPPGRLPLVNLDADLLGPAGFQPTVPKGYSAGPRITGELLEG